MSAEIKPYRYNIPGPGIVVNGLGYTLTASAEDAIAAHVSAEREACADELGRRADLAAKMRDVAAWRALASAADAIRARSIEKE